MVQDYVRKVAYLIAGGLAMLIMLYLCRWTNLPGEVAFDGSLLWQSPATVPLLLFVAFFIPAVGLLATFIVGRLNFDGGIACAAAGIAVFSFRSGRMQDVLLHAGSPNIYLTLAAEAGVLFLPLFSLFTMLENVEKLRAFRGALERAATPPDEPLTQKLLGSVMHAAVMAVILMVLCQSDDKLQVYASLLIAGYIAARVAYAFVPAEPSVYFWGSVLLVAVVGYAAAYFTTDRSAASPLAIGVTRGLLAPLARPLPTDYASFGVIGSIAGYWAARAKRLDALEATPHPA